MRADDDGHEWFDEEAGPLIRSFALTGGRAQPGAAHFDLLTYVVAVPQSEPEHPYHLQPEHLAMLERAQTPVSVAELASELGLSLGVVRVLLADLAEIGAITTIRSRATGHIPDDDTLLAVIHVLRTT